MNNKKMSLMIFAYICIGAMHLFGAADSPFEIMTKVGADQFEANIVPTIIMWVMGIAAVTAAAMKQFLPLIIGGIASFVIAFIPDVTTSFTNFDFKTLTDGTTLSVQ